MKKKTLVIISSILLLGTLAYSALVIAGKSAAGVTIYYPEKCYNGYTLYSGKDAVRLIDMNGRTVNAWPRGGVGGQVLKNGHLIIPRKGQKEKKDKIVDKPGGIVECTIFYYNLVEYDWDGKVVWNYRSNLKIHHSRQKMASGNILLICEEEVPKIYKKSITNPKRKNIALRSDYIIEVNPSKKIVWEWHGYEHLDLNRYCPNCKLNDWMHTNTVQELPENALGMKDPRFKAGNILINPRNHNTIYIIDKKTKEVVWSWGKGVLGHPHHPTMLKNGNIIIFDNGLHRKLKEPKRKISRILEIDPTAKKIVWDYKLKESLYSGTRSSAQKLPNGNVLVYSFEAGTILEVTPQKEIVWEFIGPKWQEVSDVASRAFRIPYDHCPQSAALPKPKEEVVIPRKALRPFIFKSII